MQQITIKGLSENLASLITRHSDLDNKSIASKENENLHKIIERQMEAVYKERCLIETLICNKLAEDVVEAVCQIAIVAGTLETLKDDESLPESDREFLENAYLAIRSVQHVLEKDGKTNSVAYKTIKGFCASDYTFPFDLEKEAA